MPHLFGEQAPLGPGVPIVADAQRPFVVPEGYFLDPIRISLGQSLDLRLSTGLEFPGLGVGLGGGPAIIAGFSKNTDQAEKQAEDQSCGQKHETSQANPFSSQPSHQMAVLCPKYTKTEVPFHPVCCPNPLIAVHLGI
jgi:hypothetical protein